MFTNLFAPINIGDLTLKNRIVMAPMASNLCENDGSIGERIITYYAARAKGGAGLVTTEASSVDSNWLFPTGFHIRTDDDRFIPSLTRLVEAIHAGGAKASAQIAHAGSAAYNPNDPKALRVAPSPIAFQPHEPTPRALSIAEIHELVDAWRLAARRAKLAGYDAVEVHGAHGYLLSQFLAPNCNVRDDEYGGDVRGRARFILEVVAAIKQECGQRFPVVVRLNGEDVEGGITPEETAVVAKMLEEAGANAVSISIGSRRAHQPKGHPPYYYPEGLNLHLAAQIKQAVGIPVIGVGRINNPEFADKALGEGKADLLALGRGLIADPEWANKAASGRLEEIVPCLACNRCTESHRIHGNLMSCTVNPAVGREAEFALVRTQQPKRVAVAGSGPGGMEAARIAALRGHEVTLYEKADELGGQLIVGGRPPHKEGLNRLRAYYVAQLEKCGVQVKVGCALTPEIVEQTKPEAVVVAAGVVPFIPEIPGVRRSKVVTADQALAGCPVGDTVIVIGGESVGCETADFLATADKKVTLMRRGTRLATDIQAGVRAMLLRRLRAEGVVVKVGVQGYEEITETSLVFLNEEGKREALAADTIVLATGVRQNDGLRHALEGKVGELYSVGDCVEPRSILPAVKEGAEVGRLI